MEYPLLNGCLIFTNYIGRFFVSGTKRKSIGYAFLLLSTLLFSGVAGSASDSNLESYSLPVSGKTIDIDGNDKFDALTAEYVRTVGNTSDFWSSS